MAFWWPWILAMAPYCAPAVTWHMRHNLRLWSVRSGLASHWTCERWLAARVLSALGFMLFCLAAGSLLGLSLRLIVLGVCVCLVVGFFWPELWLRRIAAARQKRMRQELAFMLDLLGLCVEAGLSLSAALNQVTSQAPSGLLRDSLAQAASLERTGLSRQQWLAKWAANVDLPGVHSLVLALAQADRLGMNLGPLLRAQAARERSERFQRAEKMALQAPVKMLLPMIVCIFPCTFIVIAFPIVVQIMDSSL